MPRRVILSRTDAIGDVVLTLPAAGILKKQFPESRVIFFGRTYTQPVIAACEYVDEFFNYDDFVKLNSSERKKFLEDIHADAIIHVFPRPGIAAAAKAAGIPLRIGTTNRLYHWWTCNTLIPSGRKNSSLHEAQLNTKLLSPFGIREKFQAAELKNFFGLTKIKPLPGELQQKLSNVKFNLVLHPKSNVSAREWSLQRYGELIRLLPPVKFNIFITGTEKEKATMSDWLQSLPPHVHDYTAKMNLDELISFLNRIDGLVAASTGPLHIAGALGKHVLGIYPPIRPMHPGRWAPLGERAEFAVNNKTCSDCRSSSVQCHCMNEISASEVVQRILSWRKVNGVIV